MNKKIIAGVTALGLGFVGVSQAFANTQVASASGKKWIQLTEAEKTQIASMSDAEKQSFYAQKKSEQKAKKTAQDAVIDKLLAGQALTAEEEKIRQELITERAERKAKSAERKAKMEQYQAIKAKQTAGETLTASEQAILTEMSQKKGSKQNRNKNTQSTQTAQ